MLKKSLVLLALFFILPAFSAYDPMSEEPIESVEQFYAEDDNEEAASENKTQELERTSKDAVDEASVDVNTSVVVEPTKDYAGIYNSLEVPSHSYLHNIDPDQYYDMKDASWAPYPLLRLNSYIYFKDRAIEPGYYLLTPREHKGKWYLLLKQNGQVAHIIPVYERDIVPELFYDKHLPKPKLTRAQKMHMGFLDFLGNFSSTKRKEPIKSYMEINDLENHFVSIIVYYGNHKYSTIFRTIKL